MLRLIFKVRILLWGSEIRGVGGLGNVVEENKEVRERVGVFGRGWEDC